MKKYIILAETGGDVPQDLIDKYGIYTVPMHVSFGDVTKDDGTFPVTDIFEYYEKTKQLPQTAGTNMYDFEQVYDKIHAEHPESTILYLAYSAVTTVSYQCGLNAMEDRDYIVAFDTKFASAGQAFVIEKVAQYIEANESASVDDIINYATEIRSRTHMGFFPGDLEYLRAGGRVSNAAYLGAKILSLNPLIEIDDGYLIAKKKYRGKMAKVSKKLIKDFTEEHNLCKDYVMLIFSPRLPEDLKAELMEYTKSLGFEKVRWVQTGSVVSTHSGPAAFGITGMSEK